MDQPLAPAWFLELYNRTGQPWVGTTYFVDGVNGADTNVGTDPLHPFLTLTHTIGVLQNGDRIILGNGTYDGVHTLARNGVTLFCQSGAVIRNSTPGTALIISGDYCEMYGGLVTEGGQTGLQVTGDYFYGENIRAAGCAVGFDLSGTYALLKKCVSKAHTTTGFDVSDELNSLVECESNGTPATRGFYLSHTDAEQCLLYMCNSINNSAAGYELVAGADSNVISQCNQSELCGGPIDAGANNTWIWGEESQVAVGNSLQQDIADVHTPVTALSTRALFYVDYWSEFQEEVQVAQAAGTLSLPSVTVAGLTLGTIVMAFAMFKFRMVENAYAGVNKLDGGTVASTSQVIQVRDDTPGTYRDAINLVDDLFTLADSARESGDVLMGQVDIAVEVDGNDTYNFRWLLAKADQDFIQFNDVQVGLRIWYMV